MLHVYLDTRVLPVTYDVIKYMVFCNAVAKKNNIERIHVHIVAVGFRQLTPRDFGTSDPEKRSRVKNIFIGLSFLFPRVCAVDYSEVAPETVCFPCLPEKYNPFSPPRVPYGFDLLENISSQGLPIKILRPTNAGLFKTQAIRNGGRYATMTLRKSLWDAARDGALEIYYAAYKKLEATLNCKIIVVPDYDDVFIGQQYKNYPWSSFEGASVDQDVRVALYSESLVNICMAGGTASLAYLVEAPFISFGNLNNKSPVGNLEFYKRSNIKIGWQPSWFGSTHRFDWREASEVDVEHIVSQSIDRLKR